MQTNDSVEQQARRTGVMERERVVRFGQECQGCSWRLTALTVSDDEEYGYPKALQELDMKLNEAYSQLALSIASTMPEVKLSDFVIIHAAANAAFRQMWRNRERKAKIRPEEQPLKLIPYIRCVLREAMQGGVTAARSMSLVNREMVERSQKCACYSCEAVFDAKEVNDYWDHHTTAVCPRCGIDAVVPDACGFPMTPDFIHKMHVDGFGRE